MNSASPSHAWPPPPTPGEPTRVKPMTTRTRPAVRAGHGRTPNQSHASTLVTTAVTTVTITSPGDGAGGTVAEKDRQAEETRDREAQGGEIPARQRALHAPARQHELAGVDEHGEHRGADGQRGARARRRDAQAWAAARRHQISPARSVSVGTKRWRPVMCWPWASS